MISVPSFNWETGCWSSGSPPLATLCIAGDWAPIRHFKSIIETDPASLYTDLLPVIQSTDLCVVNLEAPLSDRGSPVIKSGAVFKGESRHIQGLTALPVDAVTLANNHVFDFGPAAFQDTLGLLEKNNIKWTGAGMTIEEAAKPMILTAKGIRIAIVNFSEGEDLTAAGKGPGVMGWEIPRIQAQIQTLKKEVDQVVVIAHCGLEYIPFAPPYVMDAFIKMAEAGADAVIGHHPHVPQGIKFHKGVPICCSLGNFVFYQDTDLYFRKLGYLVKLGLTRDALVSLDLVPYQIRDQGLSALKGEDQDTFFTRFKEISLPLDTRQGIDDAWNGFLHYYGRKGFKNELASIMETMESHPQKGAAMFRNRLTCPQHFYHWRDMMTRMVTGEIETSLTWARNLAEEWLTRKKLD
ncbi:MAG: CapA family protein [Proteobacteria bacterium]|nr:CapA family protein [Desulfobacula sp.]MBU3951986.1 CapA family protein [Pseudomonadota bacterium]MBU4133256.1 CapA family protein [Pseudomonadota bacterium]